MKLVPSPNRAARAVLAAAPATVVLAAIVAAAETAVEVAAKDFRTRITARWRVSLASLVGSPVTSASAVAVMLPLRKPIPRRGYDNDIQEAPERNEAHGQ